ncbi:MAG: hypothetical protein AB7E05_14255 [Sphingobium sp.]
MAADDTIHLVIRDQSPDDYSARGLALYLGDGTLFAIYGQADPIVSKTAASMMMLAIDVRFEDIDATSLTFGDANFLNPPATTEVQGVVELATVAEATAGTDPVRATTPKSVKDAVTAWLDSRFGANNALVWNPNNDGAGSGLDADMLDGLQAAAFLLASAYTAADVRAKLLTVDGAGSGLDADLLDGLQGADFAQLGPAPTTTSAGMSLDLNLINKSGWYTAATTSNGPGNNTTVILHVERAFAAGQTAMQLAVNQNGHLAFRSATGAGGGRVWLDWGQVWTAVNDGAGSGLDADMLDGLHAADFVGPNSLGAYAAHRVATVRGGYYGIAFGAGGDGSVIMFNAAGQGGLYHQGSSTWIAYWNGTDLHIGATASAAKAWHAANDGAGSGLDADLLDGLHASAFLLASAYTAADVRAKLLTVDGAGSGIDADLLDGQHGSYFQNLANSTGTLPNARLSGSYDSVTEMSMTRMRLTTTADATELSTAHALQIGPDNGANIAFDNNEIMGRNNGAGAQVYFEFGINIGGPERLTAGGSPYWHPSNDGAGTGLDADLLDGQQGSYYTNITARLGYTPLNQATYTAADIRTKLLTVDGAGTGIDADLLDGLHAAAFVLASAYTASDVRTKLLTVDGAGSGIDADLLDGFQGSAYDRVTSQSLIENGGYIVYASGRKECWGYVDVAKDTTVTVTLPTTHASWVNPIIAATATGIDQTDNTGISSIVDANNFRITNGNVAIRVYWRSIGV